MQLFLFSLSSLSPCLLLFTSVYAAALRRDAIPSPSASTVGIAPTDVAGSVAAYNAGLALSDTTPDSDDNITDNALRLVRFNGCSKTQQAAIYSGWQQAIKMMKLKNIKEGTVDFNSAGALDYLGASSLNADRQSDMNKVFKNFATMTRAWSWNAWSLHVRCDDPNFLCLCDSGGRTAAYTIQQDAESGLARINFCPVYFDIPSLDSVIQHNQYQVSWVKFDMNRYSRSQGRIWAHELLHIDWVSTADKSATIEPVDDLSIEFIKEGNGQEPLRVKMVAYGPMATKILARYDIKTGDYTIRNADNLALYLTSQYVQSRLDNQYPHYPFVDVSSPDTAPSTVYNTLFIEYSNGSVALNASNPLADVFVASSATECPTEDDTEAQVPPLFIESFAPDSAYPPDYISSRSAWLASETQAPDAGMTEAPGLVATSTVVDATLVPSSSPPPQDTAPVCTGSATKWTPRDELNSVIPVFCADAVQQGVQDQNSDAITRNYLSANDTVLLSIEWPSGSPWKPNSADCINFLSATMDGCDTDAASNPMNWKHGGYVVSDLTIYNIIPQVDRGYVPGTCSFHLHEEEDFAGRDLPGQERTHEYFLRDAIKDGGNNIVTSVTNDLRFGIDGGDPYVCNSFYAPLAMTPESQNGDYIQFVIGSLSWTTTDSTGTGRCNTGAWDGEFTPVGRDMDCFFPC